VVIAQRADGAVTVNVPRRICFYAGPSSVKTPLGPGLDKVAESLRRRPQAHLALAAPDDGTANPALTQRAAQIQAALKQRGVAPKRIYLPITTAATGA
jgi:hypothetical protein